MKKKQDTKKDKRSRSWTFIVYPESVPLDWISILNDMNLKWIQSPLHDKDIEETGEVKKPHYHIALIFSTMKSFEQIKEITDKLNSPIPQLVGSMEGLVRYMIHMDQPDKFQYLRSDIVSYGGADASEYFKVRSSERYALISEMMDYIDNNNITEIKVILNYARKNRFDDWFPLLCDNSAYIIGQHIKSNRHSREVSVKVVKVNQDGEVI
jgi:hypothetical protein